MESAKVQIGDRFGEPHVSIKFNAQGAKDFDRITGDNVKKRLAIVLDGMVHSAPVIQERISGGQAQITGAFTMDEATSSWVLKGLDAHTMTWAPPALIRSGKPAATATKVMKRRREIAMGMMTTSTKFFPDGPARRDSVTP